ncbi:MAG TPA: TolC family protein [Opitutaceae bacterium]|nr:TolC family protein [Opitutaceae bacterium]
MPRTSQPAPRVVAFAVLLCAVRIAAASVEPAPVLTLDDALAEVRARHPALAAARAGVDAARARSDGASAWADPRVSVELMRNDTTRLSTYSEVELMVSQEIPLAGRPRLKTGVANAEASVAETMVLVRERMLLNQARGAYVKAAGAAGQFAALAELRKNLELRFSLVRQAYESGARSQGDVTELSVALSRLDAERTELETVEQEARAQLDALMLRSGETTAQPLVLPTPAPPAHSSEVARQMALANHPDLLLLARKLAATDARLALAKTNRTPDLEVMVRAKQMNRSGDLISAYDTGVSFSVPWFNGRRTRSEVAEATSLAREAQADSESASAELAGMVTSMHRRMSADYDQWLRQRDELIPLARVQTEITRRNYETGRAILTDLLAADGAVLEAELALARLASAHARTASDFDFLTAGRL